MKVDIAELTRASMALRELSPQAWERLVVALEEYSRGVAVAMVSSSPDVILRSQGMALQAMTIADNFRRTPENYEKLVRGKP